MTAVTPTDRPKSVRNSCVIKVFGGVFMLSRCFLDCSVGVGVFVTGLSQISSFFSYSFNVFCYGNENKLCRGLILIHFNCQIIRLLNFMHLDLNVLEYSANLIKYQILL